MGFRDAAKAEEMIRGDIVELTSRLTITDQQIEQLTQQRAGLVATIERWQAVIEDATSDTSDAEDKE